MNKSLFNHFLDIFSKLTTSIFIVSSFYIYFFTGIKSLVSLSYIWGVLIVSFLISLASLPLFTEKNISKTCYRLLYIGFFIFSNAVVLAAGLILGWFSLQSPSTIIGMEITFIVVYIIVQISIYFSIKHSTQKMNEQLKKIKKVEMEA